MSLNIHDAKTHFSRLIDRVAAGETITIARAGRPVAKLTPLDAPVTPKRTGFLEGQASIPDDFDEMDAGAIRALFEGADDSSA